MTDATQALGRAIARHCDGSARFVDDGPALANLLVAVPVMAPRAHADIVRLELDAARAAPGVKAVFCAADLPQGVRLGAIVEDEPVFAESVVLHHGQTIALVVADDLARARAAASIVAVEYRDREALLDIASARSAESFHGVARRIRRGPVDQALEDCDLRLSGTVRSGGQDHLYLETHAVVAVPGEGAAMTVYASTQHPAGVQAAVAKVLGVARHQVDCEVTRVGGGFGGKESQGRAQAAMAAFAARRLCRPVKLRLDRDADMIQTGKRHPFETEFEVGFTRDGRLMGLRARLFADGGWSADLSSAVLERALLHVDNAYHVPAIDIEGRVCRTHLPSNTAFRGFGGPQGMLVIEQILDEAAHRLGTDPARLRRLNLYGRTPRDRTPYGQAFTDAAELEGLWDQLLADAGYGERRAAIEAENLQSRFIRRGIAITPVKFGISFTNSALNHGTAFVVVHADGSVQLNHGGVEMGQGLRDKMVAVCAQGLGVASETIRSMPTATDKIANMPPTAASSGSDLNGAAVANACAKIRSRLAEVAVKTLGGKSSDLQFEHGRIFHPSAPGVAMCFAELAAQACQLRVCTSAMGYHRTPGLKYDHDLGQGTPFFYYSIGAAVAEVEVNGLTGQYRVRRVDICHDVGKPLLDRVDRGQIEGGFVQGLGWVTTEELVVDERGRLLTHGPSTYEIPTAGDVPLEFHVRHFDGARSPAVLGSRAVGEPPLMLALSVVSALHHAISSWGTRESAPLRLEVPCTPEKVARVIHERELDERDAVADGMKADLKG